MERNVFCTISVPPIPLRRRFVTAALAKPIHTGINNSQHNKFTGQLEAAADCYSKEYCNFGQLFYAFSLA